MNTRLIRFYGPEKQKLSCGIQALQLLPNGRLAVGAGDGTLAILDSSLKRSRSAKVSGPVTSVSISADGTQVLTPAQVRSSLLPFFLSVFGGVTY